MYTFNSRIRYSELNHQKGIMDTSSIINYFQDCSTFQSEDINLGLNYLQDKNRGWLLNSWQVQIKRLAHLGENITIGTWAYGFKGIYGYRNFLIKDFKDEVLAVANSVWVFIDTETRRPTRIPDQIGYEIEPPFDMNYAERKIVIPPDMITLPSFNVVKSNIDSYNHVNNGQYIKMAEEYLPECFIVSQMRAEYRMSAVLGDIIVPKISNDSDCYTIVLSNSENKPFAIMEFQGKHIKN